MVELFRFLIQNGTNIVTGLYLFNLLFQLSAYNHLSGEIESEKKPSIVNSNTGYGSQELNKQQMFSKKICEIKIFRSLTENSIISLTF